MDYNTGYKRKLVTPQQAVATIPSGAWVDYGFCTGHPVVLDKALAQRLTADASLTDLHFRGCISLWQPEVTKLPDVAERLTWNSWHYTGVERKLQERGFVFYIPMRFSEVPRYYLENIRHVDVAMFQVAPMDEEGYFNFGPAATYLSALCRCADRVIVEVNQNMPVCHGERGNRIHVSDVTMVVEGDNPPLGQLPCAVPDSRDEAVARLILPQIPNGACLQLGIGGMPNAVGSLIAQSDLTDLGVHTEILADSFVEMAAAGKLTGKKKQLHPGKVVYTFAAGTEKLYRYVHDNPDLLIASVDYVNDVTTISANDNVVSINNAVEVDLFGQVVSESFGTRHISGAGGQLDFVLGTYRSKGGKSFICCSSTVAGKDGVLKSRITPTITPGGAVTATRTNIQYLVTEFGMVNLKGLTTWQRAEAIVSVAHPQFQEELIAQALAMGIWRRSNRR